jgi:predicted ester cyclase
MEAAGNDERIRNLARAFMHDAETSGVGFIDRWIRPEFKSHLLGKDARSLDVAGYTELAREFSSAHTELTHEVHETVVEGNTIALLMTFHFVKAGAAHGPERISAPETVFLRFVDDKVAEEWSVIDMASAKVAPFRQNGR